MHDAREYLRFANAIKKAQTNPPCMETDPELWFPETGDGRGVARIAKRFCGDCPVQTECLTYALATNQQAGIWGGLTSKERQKLNRGRSRPRQAG